jgi:hypothetical protein
MTDRELLELAAKAASLNIKAQSVNADDRWIGLIVGEKHTREKKFWNPLEDDGDALRLAVKLEMDIEITKDQLNDRWVWVYLGRHSLTESCGNDQYAATRRAIVRAAAESGRGNT